MQDPQRYLNELDLKFSCAMDESRPAVLDSAHFVGLGWDNFFFGDSQARERFLENPTRWCGPLIDPVSRERFQPNRRSPRLEVEGRLFLFAGDSTRQLFQDMPEMYQLPNFEMARR